MRWRFGAAGAARQCAPAALVRRGRAAPQLHRYAVLAVTKRHQPGTVGSTLREIRVPSPELNMEPPRRL